MRIEKLRRRPIKPHLYFQPPVCRLCMHEEVPAGRAEGEQPHNEEPDEL